MADVNPEETSIYNLLINSNPEEIGSLSEQLNALTAKGMSLGEAFEQVNASAAKAATGLEKVSEQSKQGVTQTTTDVKNLTSQLAEATNQAEKLKSALPTSLPEQGYLNALPFSNFQTGTIPGAVTGGFGGGGQADRVRDLISQMREAQNAIPEPGPEMFPGLESKKTGSLFGVGHALSVAGFMTGAPGLKEAGALVYMEQGLERAMPLLQRFGGAIAETSPGLTSMIAGFTGLSTPMAALLGVVGPLALAVGGIIIGIQAYNAGLKEGETLLKAVIEARNEYHKVIQTATSDELRAKLDGLKQEKAAMEGSLSDSVTIIKGYITQSLGEGFVPLGEGIEFINNVIQNGTIQSYDPQIVQDAVANGQKLGEQLLANGALTDQYTKSLANGETAMADAKAAAEKLWKAMDEAALKGAEGVRARVLEGLKDKEMADKGEVDSAKNKSQALKNENAAIEAAWGDLLKNGDKNSLEVQEQLKSYSDQYNKNAAEIANLDKVIIPAAQHTKDLADAAVALDDALKKADDAAKRAADSIKSSQEQLANQKYDAAQKELQAEQDLTQGSIQDAYQRSQIVLDESRKEKAVIQDTANAIADVRTKLGQQEVADLTNYNRKLMDDQTKYQQDVQKEQTQAYRKEQDNYQNHIEKLADIQAKQANDQQDALLNRNFLALAQVQQSKQNEIDAENTAYARKQAAVQQNLQRDLADLAIHQAEVRTQQFVEYQRKLVDDRLHAQQEIDQKNVIEQRKIAELRLHEQQQLVDLTTTENYKIAILRQGFAREIALYELQANRRIQIAQQAEQSAKIEAWSDAVKKNPSARDALAKSMGIFDQGGTFGAGEMFMKGNIPEMFNFGGAGAYSIPGAAVVMPLQGGTATPMQGGSNINLTLQIAGGNNRDLPARASQMVYDKLKEIFADA